MKIFAIIMLCLALTACISRLSRPQMIGTVVNPAGQPLVGVKIGETVSDAQGYFSLKERRYNVFLLKELLYMEAPPLHISEPVRLNGYQGCWISLSQPFGGGRAKGATWSLGQVVIYPNLGQDAVKSLPICTIKSDLN